LINHEENKKSEPISPTIFNQIPSKQNSNCSTLLNKIDSKIIKHSESTTRYGEIENCSKYSGRIDSVKSKKKDVTLGLPRNNSNYEQEDVLRTVISSLCNMLGI
jgi:hypothetical protein